MSTAEQVKALSVEKDVLVKGKYPAKQWDGQQMVPKVGYQNLRCAVMGGSFFVNAQDAIANQIQDNQNYKITITLNEYISAKGQLSFPTGEVTNFKPLS